MARNNDTSSNQPAREGVISIIGPGMTVVGDCESEGTIRVEGSVEGTVRAGKAVVVGKDGVVDGDIVTQDAVVGGRVTGSIVADSRLELQATCVIEGQVQARRIKLEEGGTVNGTVRIGEVKGAGKSGERRGGSADAPRNAGGGPAADQSGTESGAEAGAPSGAKPESGG